MKVRIGEFGWCLSGYGQSCIGYFSFTAGGIHGVSKRPPKKTESSNGFSHVLLFPLPRDFVSKSFILD
ncbi:hypothetical protein MRB53_034674 [Persea americana]|uniref:Uncharacterized protein n=1 Tax=Persea americana TaxID=3435 RepID=A0ACC2K2X9_PERAE|nr:hypothetical protein MRB53_034674 [Persea americana]